MITNTFIARRRLMLLNPRIPRPLSMLQNGSADFELLQGMGWSSTAGQRPLQATTLIRSNEAVGFLTMWRVVFSGNHVADNIPQHSEAKQLRL